jgi:hypothetical protein
MCEYMRARFSTRCSTRDVADLWVLSSTWQSPTALQVVVSTGYPRSVTAEVASSSLVVPAILLGPLPAFRLELVDSFKGAHY